MGNKMENLQWNEEKEARIEFRGLHHKVRVVVLDDLYAYEEEWTKDYTQAIETFLNAFPLWNNIAMQAVLTYGQQQYNKVVQEKDVQLMAIFICFEQNGAPLFGLQYRTEYDIEHGCGIQIEGNTFTIVKVGQADTAFSYYTE